MTDHYTIKLRGPADLERVNKMAVWAAGQVGKGWTIVITKIRTKPQNRALWRIVDKVALQYPTYRGVEMDATDWKDLFLHGYMGATRLVVGLDEKGIAALRHRSSKLSVEQMSELIEYVQAWCAQNNVDTGE